VRYGLFGGTFNPIHFGHLRAAEEVWEAFKLDRVILIPSANPPHKDLYNIAPAKDRLEMARLAVERCDHLEVSDVEVARPGPSYSIETIKYFRKIYPGNSSIFFIIGLDAFLEITTWKSYQNIFLLSHFIVLARPGYVQYNLEEFLSKKISPKFTFNRKEKCFFHPEFLSIFYREITQLYISSTDIRSRIKEGRSIRFLVPREVENYVMEKGLYR